MYFISNIRGSSITQIEIALPEFKHGFEDMRLGCIVTNTVFAHRVDKHVLGNAGLDEFVSERPRVLRMYVVVIGAVNQH